MVIKYLSVAQMIAVEQAADNGGISYTEMMENAGESLAKVIHSAYSYVNNFRCVGLVGKGNNGGDTLVALDHLNKWGWDTCAYLIGREKDEFVQRAMDGGTKIYSYGDDHKFDKLNTLVHDNFVLMDGVLGTGIQLPLHEPIATILENVNKQLKLSNQSRQIVAVDCPSGIDCDTGEVAEQTIRANKTVVMAAVKHGLLNFPAYSFLGEIIVADIGLPVDFEPLVEINDIILDGEYIRQIIPERSLDSYKGTFGKVIIVGGSIRYPGAVMLAGKAAFRSGAGWVEMGIPASLQSMIVVDFTEATWLPLPEVEGILSEDALETLVEGLGSVTAILIGPGMTTNASAAQFIQNLIDYRFNSQIGIVFDADGLKLLANDLDWYKKIPENSILTPHPGEMSILANIPVTEIQANRLEIAKAYSHKWRQTVVLKGAFTVIATPDGRTATLPFASSALAKAGTGDVLAGIITGLRAQGLESFEAACAGVWLHAEAAKGLLTEFGSAHGILAGDLVAQIPFVLGKVLNKKKCPNSRTF